MNRSECGIEIEEIYFEERYLPNFVKPNKYFLSFDSGYLKYPTNFLVTQLYKKLHPFYLIL